MSARYKPDGTNWKNGNCSFNEKLRQLNVKFPSFTGHTNFSLYSMCFLTLSTNQSNSILVSEPSNHLQTFIQMSIGNFLNVLYLKNTSTWKYSSVIGFKIFNSMEISTKSLPILPLFLTAHFETIIFVEFPGLHFKNKSSKLFFWEQKKKQILRNTK